MGAFAKALYVITFAAEESRKEEDRLPAFQVKMLYRGLKLEQGDINKYIAAVT